jgi:hypothetical protein
VKKTAERQGWLVVKRHNGVLSFVIFWDEPPKLNREEKMSGEIVENRRLTKDELGRSLDSIRAAWLTKRASKRPGK